MFNKLYTRKLIKRLNDDLNKISILSNNVELFESCIEDLYRKFAMQYYYSIYELKKSKKIKYYEKNDINFESCESQKYTFFSLDDVNYISIDSNYYPVGEAKDLILEMFSYEKMIEEFLANVEDLNDCFEGDVSELERINMESYNEQSELLSNYEDTVNKIFDHADNVSYNIINKMLQEIIDSSKELSIKVKE